MPTPPTQVLSHQMSCQYTTNPDWGLKTYNKKSSVSPFTFGKVELCVLTLNDKPWTRAKEVCKALKYTEKIADIINAFRGR